MVEDMSQYACSIIEDLAEVCLPFDLCLLIWASGAIDSSVLDESGWCNSEIQQEILIPFWLLMNLNRSYDCDIVGVP